jgi:hypothetical protein
MSMLKEDRTPKTGKLAFGDAYDDEVSQREIVKLQDAVAKRSSNMETGISNLSTVDCIRIYSSTFTLASEEQRVSNNHPKV